MADHNPGTSPKDFSPKSQVWNRLKNMAPDLTLVLTELRSIAAKMASKTEMVLPEFTDHSVMHMDALWEIADLVLSPAEIDKCSPAELFVLGAAFYVHDLGMSILANSDGITALRNCDEYRSEYRRQLDSMKADSKVADDIALREAARQSHAQYCTVLVTQPLPGGSEYLIKDEEIRRMWGERIGRVAESHHWSINDVADRLGSNGRVASPSPLNGSIDLAFVACLLRIIDYAHLNHERAPYKSRSSRGPISPASLIHWDAQEIIVGPLRERDFLKYASHTEFTNVNSWWLFFEQMSGLDKEIRSTSEFLDARTASHGRFSLAGVLGVESAERFQQHVRLGAGIQPIDIRLQPGSLKRLVGLLGGPTLYGDDSAVPVRELIQNAVDAIRLRRLVSGANGLLNQSGQITITCATQNERTVLTVADNGVGMSLMVLTHHLVGIASDYWNSRDFYREYPSARAAGFAPLGRFGLGFLSVFLVAHTVEVETETSMGTRYLLELHEIGSRGSVKVLPKTGEVGTSIRLHLNSPLALAPERISSVIRARAPMVSIPISVRVSHDNVEQSEEIIEPGWWRKEIKEDLLDFVWRWDELAGRPRIHDPNLSIASWVQRLKDLQIAEASHNKESDEHSQLMSLWPETFPTACGAEDSSAQQFRLFHFSPKDGYAVVDPGLLICLGGIAVARVPGRGGPVGMIDITSLELTAGRHEIPVEMLKTIDSKVAECLKDDIIAQISNLGERVKSFAGCEFLAMVASRTAPSVLADADVPWIPLYQFPNARSWLTPKSFVALAKEVSGIAIVTSPEPEIDIAEKGIAELARDAVNRSAFILCPPFKGLQFHYRFVLDNLTRECGNFEEQLERLSGFENPPLGMLRAISELIFHAWDVPSSSRRCDIQDFRCTREGGKNVGIICIFNRA